VTAELTLLKGHNEDHPGNAQKLADVLIRCVRGGHWRADLLRGIVESHPNPGLVYEHLGRLLLETPPDANGE
jgi:hypothetical protein